MAYGIFMLKLLYILLKYTKTAVSFGFYDIG